MSIAKISLDDALVRALLDKTTRIPNPRRVWRVWTALVHLISVNLCMKAIRREEIWISVPWNHSEEIEGVIVDWHLQVLLAGRLVRTLVWVHWLLLLLLTLCCLLRLWPRLAWDPRDMGGILKWRTLVRGIVLPLSCIPVLWFDIHALWYRRGAIEWRPPSCRNLAKRAMLLIGIHEEIWNVLWSGTRGAINKRWTRRTFVIKRGNGFCLSTDKHNMYATDSKIDRNGSTSKLGCWQIPSALIKDKGGGDSSCAGVPVGPLLSNHSETSAGSERRFGTSLSSILVGTRKKTAASVVNCNKHGKTSADLSVYGFDRHPSR